MFRSLLIPIDLSPVSSRVLRRAGLLPLAPDAVVTLLHVVPRTLPPSTRHDAEADARRALRRWARALSSALPGALRVNPRVTTGAAATEIAEMASRTGAELIVMGRGGGRALRDLLLGSTAERVLRRARVPVLVARGAGHARYRRPLLALDSDGAAAPALKAALRLLPSPPPRLGLVHAYEIPYYGAVYPSVSEGRAAKLREEFRQRALRDIAQVLAAGLAGRKHAGSEELRWKAHVRHGSARRVILDTTTRTDADLLVLGTRAHSGMAQALLGTVSGDVLREAPCDVLVVPPTVAPRSSRGAAGTRQAGTPSGHHREETLGLH